MALSGRAAAHCMKGDYEGALVDLNASIQKNPHRAVSYYHRWLVHKKKGKKEEASADLQKAIELDPSLKEKAMGCDCR